ncbi:MAG: preprotein translocase subunit YajC [Acidaminococcaceae bacterium]|nr:preprotein translocase subunit YajC [Acidaminococcaceae bacterium]
MQSADTMAILNSVFPFLLMGGMFYFMLWRPQKQERLRREELLNNLKVGDKIMTIGGIYGTITDISEKKIKLLIAENVEIEMARSAVSGVQTL